LDGWVLGWVGNGPVGQEEGLSAHVRRHGQFLGPCSSADLAIMAFYIRTSHLPCGMLTKLSKATYF